MDSTLVSAAFDVRTEPAGGLSRQGTKFGSTPDQKAKNRGRKYLRRRRAAALAFGAGLQRGKGPKWARIQSCGRALGEVVRVEARGGQAVARGLMLCGQVWTCPVCSANVKAGREVEVNSAGEAWVAAGGSLALVTLTLRHDRSMSLAAVLGSLLGSTKKLRHRVSWKRLRSLSAGYVRALEVTDGENGWHPHQHFLMFIREGVTQAEVEGCLYDITTDWRDLARDSLGVVPSVERAVNLVWFGAESGAAARYVSKVAKEVTQSNTKSGRDPFALLDDDSAQSSARFVEFADAMVGHQSLAWSKGLRDLLGLGAEIEDVQLAEGVDEKELEVVVIAYVERKVWNGMHRRGEVAAYLADLEERFARWPWVVHRE